MFYRTSVSIKVMGCQGPGKGEGNLLSQRLNVLAYSPGSSGFIVAQTKHYLARPEVTKQVIVARTGHLRRGSISAFT